MTMKPNSWIVIDRATNKAVCELYNQSTVDKINFDKYRVVNPLTIKQYQRTPNYNIYKDKSQ